MQKISRILGLARQAVVLGILLVKLISDIIVLVSGATNYRCLITMIIVSSRKMGDKFSFKPKSIAISARDCTTGF